MRWMLHLSVVRAAVGSGVGGMHNTIYCTSLLPVASIRRGPTCPRVLLAGPHGRMRPGDELPDSCKLYVGNLSQASWRGGCCGFLCTIGVHQFLEPCTFCCASRM